MNRVIRSLLLSCSVLFLAACGQASGDAGATDENPSNASESTGALDFAETTHLVFMREEEKMARDVYLTFSQWYPDQTVFANISESEQKHMDAMKDKLAQFGIPDPNPDSDALPGSIGIFTGAEYGAYLTQGFNDLTTKGAQNELAALYVGALIEELDMHDIVKCPDVIVESNEGMDEDSCGLNYTDEPALTQAYNSLLDGSKNHLNAFVGRIEAVIGEGKYEAQFLSQEEVNEILGR